MTDTYLGYRGNDADTEWGTFYNPEMAPLPAHVVTALEHGPQAGQVMLALEDAATILDEGYHQTENGYAHLRGGGIQVSVRTDMPGVTPQMWSWWFGWHGSQSSRYKLWHPRAHVSAHWDDNAGDGYYVGRTSIIREYIGSASVHGGISFVEPKEVGLDPARLRDGIAVCARVISPQLPVELGSMIHQVRPIREGSEMRSRFWLGGQFVSVRRGNRLTNKAIQPIVARQLPAARDTMVHCAQEMNHLAAILPAIYVKFTGEERGGFP
jgi:hypothetical protein